MASNFKASVVLFLSLNLLFLVSSHNVDYDSNGTSTSFGNPVGNVFPNGDNTQGQFGTTNPANPTGNMLPNGGNTQSDTTKSGNPVVIRPGNVLSSANNTQGLSGTCNPLNLGVCLDLLGLVKLDIGNVPTEPCCSVIKGLLDLEAAVCLCTAIRANVLGISIDLPISLNLLLNNCGRNVPTEYICSH